MSMFSKSIKKIGRNATTLFTKGTVGDQKLFGRGSIASRAVGTVNKVASRAAESLGSASSMLSAMTPALAMIGAPELAMGASAIANTLGAGSSLAKSGGALTKQRDYHGDVGQVSQKIAENYNQFTS